MYLGMQYQGTLKPHFRLGSIITTAYLLLFGIAFCAMSSSLHARDRLPSENTTDLLPVQVDQNYTGKYAGQVWMNDILQRLPKKMSNAYRHAGTLLGVDIASLDFTQFRLDVQDAQPQNLDNWRRVNGASLKTGGYLPPDGPYIIIRIHAEFLHNGSIVNLEQELLHEAIHAIQRATVPKFREIPTWMQEGIALLLAGQGPHRVRQILAFSSIALAPEKMLNGLEEPGEYHDLNDYGEDYLAFEYLGQSAGLASLEAAKRLHGRLQAGDNWQTALESISGKTWPEFRSGVLVYAREALSRYMDAPTQSAYTAFLRTDNTIERLSLTQQFLLEHPDSPLAELAHYYMGVVYRDTQQAAKAITAFKAMLPGTFHSGMEDDAKFWIGLLEFQRGNFDAAATHFRAVVIDHPNSSWVAHSAFGWGLALEKIDHSDQARQICAKAIRSFPEHTDHQSIEAAHHCAGVGS